MTTTIPQQLRQQRAVADCVRDMQSGVPMSRLVQGDVGSGKTAVAAGVVLLIVILTVSLRSRRNRRDRRRSGYRGRKR